MGLDPSMAGGEGAASSGGSSFSFSKYIGGGEQAQQGQSGAGAASSWTSQLGPVGAILGNIAGGVQSFRKANITNKIGRFQESLAKQNASWVRLAGKESALRIRQKGYAVGSRLSSGYAAGGVKAGSGSAQDVAMATSDAFELDAVKAVFAADVQAYNINQEANLRRYVNKLEVSALNQQGWNQMISAGIGIGKMGAGGGG